jgi:hypothetical protein
MLAMRDNGHLSDEGMSQSDEPHEPAYPRHWHSRGLRAARRTSAATAAHRPRLRALSR